MMQAFVEKGGEPTAAHLIRRLLTMDTRQKALDEVLEEREDLVGKIPFGHDACYEDGKHIFSIEPVPEEVKGVDRASYKLVPRVWLKEAMREDKDLAEAVKREGILVPEEKKYEYDINYVVSGVAIMAVDYTDLLHYNENTNDAVCKALDNLANKIDTGDLQEVVRRRIGDYERTNELDGFEAEYEFTGVARCHVELSTSLPKGLNGKFNTTGKPFLADDLPLPEQDKEAIRDAFYDCGFGEIVNMATHYYIEGITLCNVKTVDCDKSAFVDAVKKYQSSLMAEGMDLTTANEHIMDAFREANTAQINYAK